MDNRLVKKLIHIMREHLPKDKNLACVLMDVLSLSKEAAYRRLRGDIMFTFEEAAKLSRKLGFSLDKVVEDGMVLDNHKWAFIDIDTFYSSSGYITEYAARLDTFSYMVGNLMNDPQATIRSALTHIPYYLILSHRNLTLFRHYKRTFLTFGLNPEFRFSDFTIPSDIREKEQRVLKGCLSIPRNILILERDAFFSIMKDISYFYQRQLISATEFSKLKEELLDILSYLEHIAATGTFGPKTEVLIYLLDTKLDTSYTHFESSDFESLIQYSYFVDMLSLYNPKLCKMQKDWIESLKRYSTLITQSGEMQRVDFFRKQKEMIQMM